MERAELRQVIERRLRAVAPDADPSSLGAREDFREALDLDSMDFLRFVQGLHGELAVDVPEADYPKLTTLEGCEAYLAAALAARTP